MEELSTNKATSKQEVAYKYIKEAIINNEFKQNTMLVETNLCKLLGFSKTPIREALRRLSSEGLVELVPEKGCFVTSITFHNFIDIFDVREVLEGMAARLCAQRLNDQTALELKEQLKKHKIYIESDFPGEVLKADIKQHEIIIASCGNNQLINFNEALQIQIKRIRFITMEDHKRLELSYLEHKRMVDAITARDYDGAEAACRAHVRSVKNFLINSNYLVDSKYLLIERNHMEDFLETK